MECDFRISIFFSESKLFFWTLDSGLLHWLHIICINTNTLPRYSFLFMLKYFLNQLFQACKENLPIKRLCSTKKCDTRNIFNILLLLFLSYYKLFNSPKILFLVANSNSSNSCSQKTITLYNLYNLYFHD